MSEAHIAPAAFHASYPNSVGFWTVSEAMCCCDAGAGVCVLLQLFITMTGVFFSSWLGSWMLAFGEWIIKRLPLVKHIYSASKQVRCHSRGSLLLAFRAAAWPGLAWPGLAWPGLQINSLV
jgi:uncharacterized membrane protein